MTTPLPALDEHAPILVMHVDDLAAVCTRDRIYPSPAIAAMPADHPDRALIDVKCLVAGAILRGDVAGPYDDHDAEVVARSLLEQFDGDSA